VDFKGELEFGLGQEPAKQLNPTDFLSKWTRATDAIVFIDPQILGAWRQKGLAGRVIAGDESTVAVSRL
jgi:hypothetical protein